MNDLLIAKRYISKADRARTSGIHFDLSLTSYINLMKAKKCKYTGITLTTPQAGGPVLPTDRTIDRIDSNIGYVKGNVAAVCNAANQIKSIWENPENPLTPEMVKKITEAVGDLT